MKLIFTLLIFIKLFNLLECYDYLILNLHWPTTVFRSSHYNGSLDILDNHVKKYGHLFTIHGLWPQTYSNNMPRNCSHDDIFKLEDITNISNIYKYWESFSAKHTTDFWK